MAPNLTIQDGQGNQYSLVDFDGTLTIASIPKVVELRPDNVPYNQYQISAAQLNSFHTSIGSMNLADPSYLARVDGKHNLGYSPSTDALISYFAAKWDFDPDVVRAQAVDESNWHQSAHGDLQHVSTQEPNGGSWGILQIAAGAKQGWPGSFPLSHLSTALNLDCCLAHLRAVRDGRGPLYLNDADRNAAAIASGNLPYVKTTDSDDLLWGAIGYWYSGGWWDAAAIGYVHKVQAILAAKPWLKPGF